MKMKIIISAIAFIFVNFSLVVGQSDEARAKVAEIQKQIEAIRGEKFLHDVEVASKTPEAFGGYLDRALEKQMSLELRENYDKVLRKLGLYRGPEIKDYRDMAKLVVQSQAAAFYDPEEKTFFVVMSGLSGPMLDVVYAHELYHGFQDQRYDLTRYFVSPATDSLNDDQALARQSVVEGEATYVSQLWALKNMLGQAPDTTMLKVALRMQSQMGVSQLLQMLKSGALPNTDNDNVKNAVASLDEIPVFLLETMMGPYFKGLGFVFEVQLKGWSQVDELYKTPPVSTEQILHPEKWFAREKPVKLAWPDFRDENALRGWKLLESNTLGELQWRIIFSEFEMEDAGLPAAEGWNGDIFAVLENQETKELLLLLYTSWDSEEDANEFATAYQDLLAVKYPKTKSAFQMKRAGSDVLIVEGGKTETMNDYLGFVARARQ